jgi:hypothetical protein
VVQQGDSDDGDDVKVRRGESAGGAGVELARASSSGGDSSSSSSLASAAAAERPSADATHTSPLSVTLRHPEEAVRLLLEYLYTNRAVDLGHDAFVTGCRTKPSHSKGPVCPFVIGTGTSRRRWPNRGEPTVSYGTAVALVRLAFEAGLPRLALMGEVAASQLVKSDCVVEALSFCHEAKYELGRDLERLRKAAMDVVLRPSSHHSKQGVWVYPSFRHELKEKRNVLVPTLISGTMEALSDAATAAATAAAALKLSHHGHGRSAVLPLSYQKLQNQFVKYDTEEWRSTVHKSFRQLDRLDKSRREEERRKRRHEMKKSHPAPALEGAASDDFDSDAAVTDSLVPPLPRRAVRRAAWVAAAAALDTSGNNHHPGHSSNKRVVFAPGVGGGGGGGNNNSRRGGGGEGRPPRRSHR